MCILLVKKTIFEHKMIKKTKLKKRFYKIKRFYCFVGTIVNPQLMSFCYKMDEK